MTNPTTPDTVLDAGVTLRGMLAHPSYHRLRVRYSPEVMDSAVATVAARFPEGIRARDVWELDPALRSECEKVETWRTPPAQLQDKYPYAIGVLSSALDGLIIQQRNLLDLLAEHSRNRASSADTSAVLEAIADNGSQIVDLNRALWTLEDRSKS